MKKRILFICMITILVLGAMSQFIYNKTESLPWVLFIRSYEPIERGDIVLLCLPITPLTEQGRGYLGYGECPSNTNHVIKILAAAAGDIITINDDGVIINGVCWENSKPMIADDTGYVLEHIQLTDYVLQTGEIIVLTTQSNSFDSRYFGAISEGSIISRLKPIEQWRRY